MKLETVFREVILHMQLTIQNPSTGHYTENKRPWSGLPETGYAYHPRAQGSSIKRLWKDF